MFSLFHILIESPNLRNMPLKEFIFREDWTCNSFTGTISLDNSRIGFWRKIVFWKKPLLAASDYCKLGCIHWDEKPVLVNKKILKKKNNKPWTSISLKPPHCSFTSYCTNIYFHTKRNQTKKNFLKLSYLTFLTSRPFSNTLFSLLCSSFHHSFS